MSKILLNTPYDEERDFPTANEIKENYKILMDLVGNITTLEQVKEINDKYALTVEINGSSIEDFSGKWKTSDGQIVDGGTNEDIEWIRYEACGWLDYIYCWIENGKVKDVSFDVWCNKYDMDFIDSARINDITDEFVQKNIEETENMMTNFRR